MANFQNYGDEPEAIDLLCPSTFVELGISEGDFEAARPREEIERLFAKIGFTYKTGKFNAIFNRARSYARNPYALPDDCTSIRCFMQAIKELHHVE